MSAAIVVQTPIVAAEPMSAAAEQAAADVLDGIRSLPPRRRHRADLEGIPQANPDVEILNLTGRLQELIALRREEEVSRASPGAARVRRRVQQRPGVPAPEEAAVTVESRPAPPTLVLPTMEARRRGTDPTAEQRLEAAVGRWGRLGVRLLVFLALPLVAFLVGRATAPSRGRPPAPQPSGELTRKPQPASATGLDPSSPTATAHWSPAALGRLEEVFTILRDGDGNRAVGLLREVRNANGSLPGLDLLLGEMQIRTNRVQEATTTLLPLFRADPPVAEACDQLGFLSARGRRLQEATDYFARAVDGDPVSGWYLYHWGESLRRQGRAAEAVTRFEQALRRRGVVGGTARSAPAAATLRLNLARLEAGQGAAVRAEAEERLKKQVPGSPDAGQMLVALAAVDLQEGHYGEAGSRLTQARDFLSSVRTPDGTPEFEVLLNDYFFRGFAARPELASVIPPAGSEADVRRVKALTGSAEVYFIDP